jgi:protein FAM92
LVADQKSIEIERVDSKILSELSQYPVICQNAKEEVKNQVAIRDREISKRRQTDVSKRIKNENEIFSSMHEIQLISEQFETQKLKDLKECMENYILIQLKYHTKCIEIFSELSREIDEIDENADAKVNLSEIEEFLRQLLIFLSRLG